MDKTNGYQGQIRANDQEVGYFASGQNIINLINNECNDQFTGFISRIGIEAPEGTQININGQNINIGKTGLYEINNVYITSLIFTSDSSTTAVIDYII